MIIFTVLMLITIFTAWYFYALIFSILSDVCLFIITYKFAKDISKRTFWAVTGFLEIAFYIFLLFFTSIVSFNALSFIYALYAGLYVIIVSGFFKLGNNIWKIKDLWKKLNLTSKKLAIQILNYERGETFLLTKDLFFYLLHQESGYFTASDLEQILNFFTKMLEKDPKIFTDLIRRIISAQTIKEMPYYPAFGFVLQQSKLELGSEWSKLCFELYNIQYYLEACIVFSEIRLQWDKAWEILWDNILKLIKNSRAKMPVQLNPKETLYILTGKIFQITNIYLYTLLVEVISNARFKEKEVYSQNIRLLDKAYLDKILRESIYYNKYVSLSSQRLIVTMDHVSKMLVLFLKDPYNLSEFKSSDFDSYIFASKALSIGFQASLQRKFIIKTLCFLLSNNVNIHLLHPLILILLNPHLQSKIYYLLLRFSLAKNLKRPQIKDKIFTLFQKKIIPELDAPIIPIKYFETVTKPTTHKHLSKGIYLVKILRNPYLQYCSAKATPHDKSSKPVQKRRIREGRKYSLYF